MSTIIFILVYNYEMDLFYRHTIEKFAEMVAFLFEIILLQKNLKTEIPKVFKTNILKSQLTFVH